MPSLEEVKRIHKELTEEAFAIIDKKGADYNRQQQKDGDTLFNLRVAYILGIVKSPQESVLVRLSDKLMRMISLADASAEAAVKDESVRDTVKDLINYAVYYYILRKEVKETADNNWVDIYVNEALEGNLECPDEGHTFDECGGCPIHD